MPPHPPETSPGPWLSIVVPMRNEAGSVAFLIDAIARACARMAPFEVICVDDGSTDATAEAVRAQQALHPNLRLIGHATRGGQSAAIHSGVEQAQGAVICTLDGDGQNPPAEIPRLVALLEGRAFAPGIGLIAGQRVRRRDVLSKRAAARAANVIRAALIRDGTRDTGCGLKLFRRDAFLALPYFDHMHRYLPALFARDGWTVLHVDVAHAERYAGQSNYSNWSRALVGVRDLVGVMWLIRRRKKVAGVERTFRP